MCKLSEIDRETAHIPMPPDRVSLCPRDGYDINPGEYYH